MWPKCSILATCRYRNGCLGGLRNLPSNQTAHMDPYDNIPEGYVVWFGPQHFLDNFFCAHFITFSVFCWVENHPYPKVLGQFLLPHKLFPHPLGCNKLGKSARKCGNTLWWPHYIYTWLSKSAEKEDGRLCYTPFIHLHVAIRRASKIVTRWCHHLEAVLYNLTCVVVLELGGC